MGLDMHLERHHYVKQWDHQRPEERHVVIVTKGGRVADYIKPERVTYVVEQVAYWRKANQIHRWFVENCQDGKDDCQDYGVDRDQLKELLDSVKAVLAHPKRAEELLPTESGFFFGGTEYDDDYFDDLRRTQEMLTALLDEPDEGEFRYRASW